MPLSDPERIARFRQEIDTRTLVVFQGVPLPARWFDLGGRQGSDVMLKRRDDGSGCILLLDQDVRYRGGDGALIAALANAARKGWRPLALIQRSQPEAVLRAADAWLGLDGQPPRDPDQPERPRPREVVIRREELAERAPANAGAADRFGVDLVAEARRGRLYAPMFRDAQTETLVRILLKEGKNAACLVGAPGVGKTAVVEGLAVAIAEGRVPETLARARVLDVNLSFLAAGATYQNEFEGRVKALLDQARGDPDVVLFLDELHTIRAHGGEAAQMIKSDLGRGRIRCIGATTHAEYRLIEADAALARRFQAVPVPEPTPAQTIVILRGARSRLEQHHGVAIPEDLCATVVDLAVRYVPDRNLPDKALDLLDEACACARLRPGEATP